MGKLTKPKSIDDVQRDQAYTAAINNARAIVREERNFLSPHTRLGTMSEFEWRKLADSMVSGWIIERSKQLHGDRLLDEESFLSEGSVPEPFELGKLAGILPALGAIVERRGLSELPIGDWPREDVISFAWHVLDLAERIAVAQKETPTDPDVASTLMAG